MPMGSVFSASVTVAPTLVTRSPETVSTAPMTRQACSATSVPRHSLVTQRHTLVDVCMSTCDKFYKNNLVHDPFVREFYAQNADRFVMDFCKID